MIIPETCQHGNVITIDCSICTAPTRQIFENVRLRAAGDVFFSKEYNRNVTVHEITDEGVLCDWFVDTEHHREFVLE